MITHTHKDSNFIKKIGSHKKKSYTWGNKFKFHDDFEISIEDRTVLEMPIIFKIYYLRFLT